MEVLSSLKESGLWGDKRSNQVRVGRGVWGDDEMETESLNNSSGKPNLTGRGLKRDLMSKNFLSVCYLFWICRLAKPPPNTFFLALVNIYISPAKVCCC